MRENRLRPSDRPGRRQYRLDLGSGARWAHRAALPRPRGGVARQPARALASRRRAEISPRRSRRQVAGASADGRGNESRVPRAASFDPAPQGGQPMTDANVAVNFTASVGDLVSGVADAKDALTSLSAPFARTERPIRRARRLDRRGVRSDAPASLRQRAHRRRLRSKRRSPPPMRKPPRRSARATRPHPPTRSERRNWRFPKRSRRSKTA